MYGAVIGKDDEPLDECLDSLYNYTMQLIYELPDSDDVRFYMTGATNFRKDLYPWYKANRADTPRPVHLTAAKRFFEAEFKATWSEGQEADDDIGIEAFLDPSYQSLIVHIDKDLNQFPGPHYNFRKKEFYDVSEVEAKQWFLHQLVLGDRVDNIPGFDGLMRPSYPKKLKYIEETINQETDFIEGLRYVWDLYNSYGKADVFHDHADCLWLLKEKGKTWKSLEIEI